MTATSPITEVEPPAWTAVAATAAQIDGLAPVSLWRVLLRSSQLAPSRRLVALTISTYSASVAHVTVEDLVGATGLVRSTVRAAINDLVKGGWVSTHQPSRRAGRHITLCWPRGPMIGPLERADREPERADENPERADENPERADGRPTVGVQRCSEGVHRRRLSAMVTRTYPDRGQELDELVAWASRQNPDDVAAALTDLSGETFGWCSSQLKPALEAKVRSARRHREKSCGRCEGHGTYYDERQAVAVICDHQAGAA